jgi:methyl-accepting chemotaxis protein
MRLALTLRSSLFAAFGLLALLCAGQGVLSITRLAGIRTNVTDVAMNWLTSVIAITNVRAAAAEVRIKELRILSLVEGSDNRAETVRQIDEANAALDKARRTYEPLISSPEERAMYDAFVTAWQRYDVIGREAIRLALDALKDVEPDNPYCSEHIEAAKLSLRTALRTLTQPA